MIRSLALCVPTALLCLTGCQSVDDAANDAHAAPTGTLASAQDSATATAVETALLSTIIDGITKDNTGAEVDSDGAMVQSAASSPLGILGAEETPFAFSASGSITVDLDAPGSDEPNLSGTIRIDYTGSVVTSVPLHTSGTADYHVTVTWITPGIYVDPHCNKTTTVASGSTWSFDALFDWDWVSDTQWSVAAETDLAIPEGTPHVATVTSGSNSHTVTSFGHRRETADITRLNDTYTIHHDVVADWFSTITGSFGDHTVHWDRDGLDEIRIIVDGVTYGPYTRAQVIGGWDCSAH